MMRDDTYLTDIRWPRVARLLIRLVASVWLVASGCAPVLRESPPTPGQPRLVDFQLDAATVSSGCPVQATFRFEDADADAAQAVMRWQHNRGSRTVESGIIPLPIEAAELRGTSAGEVTMRLMFLHPGTYWLTAQLLDAHGSRSNLREQRLNVFAQQESLGCPGQRATPR